jgi:chromosome segregation ATPase
MNFFKIVFIIGIGIMQGISLSAATGGQRDRLAKALKAKLASDFTSGQLRAENEALRAELVALRGRLAAASSRMLSVGTDAIAVIAGLPAGAASTGGAGLGGRLGSPAGGRGGTALVAAGAGLAALVAGAAALRSPTAALVAENTELFRLREEVAALQRDLAASQAQAGTSAADVVALSTEQEILRREVAAAQENARQSGRELIAARAQIAAALEGIGAAKGATREALAQLRDQAQQQIAALQTQLVQERALSDAVTAEMRGMLGQISDLHEEVNHLNSRLSEVTHERDVALFRATEEAERADAADGRAGVAEEKAVAAKKQAAEYRTKLIEAQALLSRKSKLWDDQRSELLGRLQASNAEKQSVQARYAELLGSSTAKDSELRLLRSQMDSRNADYGRRIEAMQAAFRGQLDDLRTQLQAATDSLASVQLSVRNARAVRDRALILKDQDARARFEALSHLLTEQLNSQRAAFEAQIAGKNAEIAALQDELASVRDGAAARDAALYEAQAFERQAMIQGLMSDLDRLRSASRAIRAEHYRLAAVSRMNDAIESKKRSSGFAGSIVSAFSVAKLSPDDELFMRADEAKKYCLDLLSQIFTEDEISSIDRSSPSWLVRISSFTQSVRAYFEDEFSRDRPSGPALFQKVRTMLGAARSENSSYQIVYDLLSSFRTAAAVTSPEGVFGARSPAGASGSRVLDFSSPARSDEVSGSTVLDYTDQRQLRTPLLSSASLTCTTVASLEKSKSYKVKSPLADLFKWVGSKFARSSRVGGIQKA